MIISTKILTTGGSGSGKTNALINLIKQQNNDDNNIVYKIYLYVKDPNKAKYQYVIKKYEEIRLEEPEDSLLNIQIIMSIKILKNATV